MDADVVGSLVVGMVVVCFVVGLLVENVVGFAVVVVALKRHRFKTNIHKQLEVSNLAEI